MALWICEGCSCRYSVGAPACPQCGSLEHYEEGSVMPKITVHGGPSIAGVPNENPVAADERAQEPVLLPEGAVVVPADEARELADGVDQGPGVVDETLGGGFKPLPEDVEGDTAEHVSEPDYEAWTVAQLREVLAQRELSTAGLKAELIERLRDADAEASDG